MKRTLVLFGVIAILLSVIPLFAADTDDEEMHIKVQIAFVGITLYEDDGVTPYTDWTIGMTTENTANTMTKATHIETENEGNGPVDLAIYNDDLGAYGGCAFGVGTNWGPAAAVGVDLYLLEFDEGDDTGPPGPYIPTICDDDVAPGDQVVSALAAAAVSHMYLRFTTPSTVSDGCEHDITVTVLATIP